MSNIKIYSKKDCPNCDMLKQLLSKENVEYKTVKIDTPEALTELRMNNVFTMSAPVLQIDSKFYIIGDMTTDGISNINATVAIIDKDKVMNIIENGTQQV